MALSFNKTSSIIAYSCAVESDVCVRPDILIGAAPDFSISLEADPDQVMFRAVINDEMGESFALWRDEGDGWIELGCGHAITL